MTWEDTERQLRNTAKWKECVSAGSLHSDDLREGFAAHVRRLHERHVSEFKAAVDETYPRVIFIVLVGLWGLN